MNSSIATKFLEKFTTHICNYIPRGISLTETLWFFSNINSVEYFSFEMSY